MDDKQSPISPSNFVTATVRFSHANVFEAKANKQGVLKYSACLLLDKKNRAERKRWGACVEAAILLGIKQKKFTALQRKLLKLPIRDGDDEIKMGIKKKDSGYDGVWFVNTNSNDAPTVDKPQGGRSVPIMDKSEFYSGVKGLAIISFYPFNVDGGKGIAVGLNGCLKTADGDRLDNRINANSVFQEYAKGLDDIDGEGAPEIEQGNAEVDDPDSEFG